MFAGSQQSPRRSSLVDLHRGTNRIDGVPGFIEIESVRAPPVLSSQECTRSHLDPTTHTNQWPPAIVAGMRGPAAAIVGKPRLGW